MNAYDESKEIDPRNALQRHFDRRPCSHDDLDEEEEDEQQKTITI